MNYTALMKLKKMFFMVYLSSVSKHGPKNFFFFFFFINGASVHGKHSYIFDLLMWKSGLHVLKCIWYR